MTDQKALQTLRIPTPSGPLRVLVSACLLGTLCGYDGSSYGDHPGAKRLTDYDTIRLIRFCPEDYAFGTPRELCDIHGGTGLDVLEGRARVLTESGLDWTEGMIRASEAMLDLARRRRVELAVLMDISAACGSQVIYDGSRLSENPTYQIGMGVCAAQLHRYGIPVISQRDFASLEILYRKLDPSHRVDPTAIDHHETDWYKAYFG
jgi:uncharacterized protein YbbK (DUF523 family)